MDYEKQYVEETGDKKPVLDDYQGAGGLAKYNFPCAYCKHEKGGNCPFIMGDANCRNRFEFDKDNS